MIMCVYEVFDERGFSFFFSNEEAALDFISMKQLDENAREHTVYDKAEDAIRDIKIKEILDKLSDEEYKLLESYFVA